MPPAKEKWALLRAIFPEDPSDLLNEVKDDYSFWLGAGDDARAAGLASLGGAYVKPPSGFNRKEEKSRDLVLARVPRSDGADLSWTTDVQEWFGDLADSEGVVEFGAVGVVPASPFPAMVGGIDLVALVQRVSSLEQSNMSLSKTNTDMAAELAVLRSTQPSSFVPSCTYELREDVISEIPGGFRDRKPLDPTARAAALRTLCARFDAFPSRPAADGFWEESKGVQAAKVHCLPVI